MKSVSIFRYILVSFSILFLLAIISMCFDHTLYSESLDDKPLFRIDRFPSIEHSPNQNRISKLILNTTGCKIGIRILDPKSSNSTTKPASNFREIEEENKKCHVPLTSLNNNENLNFKVHESMTYSNLSCCASYWNSSNSFKERTPCTNIDHMDSMMGKEFIKVQCCYKWMKVLSMCTRDIHANAHVSSKVQRKIAFWEQRMSNFTGLPPSILILRLRTPKYSQIAGNSIDVNTLSHLQFVQISGLVHRGKRNSWPFYTKYNVQGVSPIHKQNTSVQPLWKNASNHNSKGKKSLLSLFSSINHYVTFSILGNHSLQNLVKKQKFDYNFEKFLQGVKEDCIGKLSIEEYALKYTARILGKLQRTPFFGSIILDGPSTNKSKDLVTRFLQTMLLDRHINEHTLIILMEDPDVQSRQPSQFLIRVPENYAEEETPILNSILNVNKNRLVTASDLHETLIGVFKVGCRYRRFNEVDFKRKCSSEVQSIPKGVSLLTSVIPGNRNCSSAGIHRYFCPCMA